MATLVLNKLKGVFNTVAVKAPAFGDRRKDILEDIAILTGGEVISGDRGITFENAEVSMLGTARKVIVTKDETTIIEGAGTQAAIKARIDQINKQIDAASSEYDKENLEKRRAALQGKVAVIKVGGATETEIEEKKFRVDDAVAAVKAAMDEGVVPGGGMTMAALSFMLADSHLKGKIKAEKPLLTGDAGADILIRALNEPFKQLLENAGLDPSGYMVQIAGKPGKGVDVNTGKIVDLKEAGIIDPTRVVKEAIQNAASIAGTAMTMGALVVDVPEKAQPMGGAPDMGGMGMM